MFDFNIENKKFTTLDVTINSETEAINSGVTGFYFKLTTGKGEKCIKRNDLIQNNSNWSYCSDSNLSNSNFNSKKIKKIKPLGTFVQITDIHIISATNASRASFLAKFIPEIPELSESFRAYEGFSTQVAECMVRRINAIARGPHLKQNFELVVNTGDNGDSQLTTELQNYINILDGKLVNPNPADPGNYVGVQDNFPSESYPVYYHPDQAPDGIPNDFYKLGFGYPNFQDILNSAMKSFKATGLKIPWYTCNGNHDSVKLGNYSLGFYKMLTLFDQIAVGQIPELGSKLIETMSPLQAKALLGALITQDADKVLEIINRSSLREIPNTEKTVQYTSADFINMHFNTSLFPGPIGHGFTKKNIEENVLYYTFKISECITGIMLDTCNPNGNLVDFSLAANGSIGYIQLSWLENELRKRSSRYYNNQGQLVKTNNKDEIIILFGHHSISTLNNNFADLKNTFDKDPQRITGKEFRKVIHRYPNIVSFICGHEHINRIFPFPDPTGKTNGFWEIITASHIDYPQQSRIIEVGDNNDGTLSIFCTMIDHLSPANVHRGCFPTGPAQNCCNKSNNSCSTSSSNSSSSSNSNNSNNSNNSSSSNSSNSNNSCKTKCKEEYSIEEIASISRELSFNDPFIVDQFDDALERTGTKLDRNVELLIFNPLHCNKK